MTTPNRKQVDELIDRLADKSLTFGCRVYCERDEKVRLISADKKKNQWWLVLEYPSYHERFVKYLIQDGDEFSMGDGEIKTGIVKILGHPILIGDVLEKTIKKVEFAGWEKKIELMKLWESACWNPHIPLQDRKYFTKSLQEIIEASGWEEVNCHCSKQKIPHLNCESCLPVKRLLDPNARALIEFIYNLGI